MITGIRQRLCLAVLLLLGGSAIMGLATAPSEDKKPAPLLELPAVLDKVAPENVADLQALENHVRKVLKKILPSVVGIVIGPGQGSGVIVSEEGLVLTAGHVSGTPGKKALVLLPDSTKLTGKTLGRWIDIDSGMVKITDEGKYPYVEMGKSSELKKGQWVIAVGQPGGFRKNRTPVVRVGRILYVDNRVIRTDCVLVGGDSGGPLFDMQGRVIGIHSRIGGSITENVHVPIDTYRNYWDRLVKGESWGTRIGETIVASRGGKIVFEKKDKLTTKDERDTVQQESYCKIFPFRMKAGTTYTIDLRGSDKSGRKMDPLLRLEDANGMELAQDDDGGGFPDARIVHKAAKDGEYRLVVTTVLSDQTGPFQLTVREAEMYRGTVELMRAVELPPPAVPKLLELLAKEKLRLLFSVVLYDDKGAPQPGKNVTFQWEQGKETLKTNERGAVRWALKKDRSKKLLMQLPAGVRASVVLTDQNGDDFPPFFAPAPESVKSAGGPVVKTIDGTLSSEDPIDRKRKKCHAQVHEFKMEAGKTYTLDLVSEDFDAYLRLENADEKNLKEDDDGAGFLNSRIVFTPSSDGTYRIIVTTCDPGELGSYRLTIREKK